MSRTLTVAGAHQPNPPRPRRIRMSLPMASRTQANQVVHTVRIGTPPTGNVMHVRHSRHTAELAHPVPALPHLLSACRIDFITLATLIRHGLHGRISSSIARFNASRSTCTISATSRIDRLVPPARSHSMNVSITSGGHGTFCCDPHSSHRHTSRHGRRSNLVRVIETGIAHPQFRHTLLCAIRSGSASASKFRLCSVRSDDGLKGGELSTS